MKHSPFIMWQMFYTPQSKGTHLQTKGQTKQLCSETNSKSTPQVQSDQGRIHQNSSLRHMKSQTVSQTSSPPSPRDDAEDLRAQAWCAATSCPMKRRRRSRYWLYSSMSLCPAPSTQRGSTALGQRSNRARPWEKSITSSSVPWIMSTGDVILDTFSMLKRGRAVC